MSIRIACIISDHGFGHAARDCAIINFLLRKKISVYIVSGVPRRFFEDSLCLPFDFFQCKVDVGALHFGKLPHLTVVGVKQITSVEVDEAGTAVDLERHWSNISALSAEIDQKLRSWSPHLIFFDLSAVACVVAKRLNVPAVGMSNFTWDWIYEHIAKNLRSQEQYDLAQKFEQFADLHAREYQSCALYLSLPNGSDARAFPRQEQIPWVARTSQRHTSETRQLLGLPSSRKILLFSFGGHDFPLNPSAWVLPSDWSVLLVSVLAASVGDAPLPDGIFVRREDAIIAAGVSYVDIVACADCLVGKIGYGLVSECIAHHRPILYVKRNAFEEEKLLLGALADAHHPMAEVGLQDVVNTSPTLFDAARRVSTAAPYAGIPAAAALGAEAVADRLIAEARAH